jgi:hypothetical protein
MEDIAKTIESLLEKATDYGKTSYELIRLKTIDKTTDVISSCVPPFIAYTLTVIFLLILSMGASLWIGEILGKTYYGFFVIAGFYVFLLMIIRLFMYKWIKKLAKDNFIKQMLK